MMRNPNNHQDCFPAVRLTYVIAMWISTFCAVTGTLSDFRYTQYANLTQSQNGAHSFQTTDYINFTLGIAAATIAAYTANKFQGIKIGMADEDYESAHHFPYDIAPRTRKSNTYEIAYLLFSTLLLLFNNYFFVAAFEGAVQTFKTPNNPTPLLPLSIAGWVLLVIKTFFIDLIFNMSNANFEAAEEIKGDITGSKTQPLISRMFIPLTKGWLYTLTIRWIKTAGVFSHTFTDYLSLVLSIPPNWLIGLYKTPPFFWLLTIAGLCVSGPLLFVNSVQTLFFEGKESEINLRRIQRENMENEALRFPDPPHNKLLRTLLRCMPYITKPIRLGFYTQGPLNAAGHMMPVVLFLQTISVRFDINKDISDAMISVFAIYTLISIGFGTHFSEVTTALHHYDEDFNTEKIEKIKEMDEQDHNKISRYGIQ